LPVLEPPIPKSVRFAEAPAAGRSVLVTASSGKGSEAYREHARALVNASAEAPAAVTISLDDPPTQPSRRSRRRVSA
jgi:hypothetical protein